MDRSEWDDDEQYPPAPVPAHERGWRHPSEIAAQAWVQSEPPLAIGRGLTAATGAVGTVLALAVLWAMLPTHAGRSAVVSVRSTLSSSVAGGLLTDTTLTGPTVTSPPASAPTTAAAPASTTGQQQSSTTDTIDARPVPTYQLHPAGSPQPGAVAVAVDAGHLVITTASAVATDNTVELRLADGTVEQARVLLVDQRSGLAVLTPTAADEVTGFAVAAGTTAGEVLTVYGDERVQLPVDAAGVVHTEAAAATLPEGTPVVNQRGELVALCSHGEQGIVLLSLDKLDSLRRALAATSTPPVWLGVVLNDDPSGALSIGAVDPAGPAAAAGLQVGDVIVAVDGQQVANRAQLTEALSHHRPGDTVAVTVAGSSGTTSIVKVSLAAPKASL